VIIGIDIRAKILQILKVQNVKKKRVKLAENVQLDLRVKIMNDKLTSEELLTRLKVFVGVCLALTLMGIVFVVLYSIIFVTQPLDAISPVDSKFFELIIPIATFLTGTLSGIMLGSSGDKKCKDKKDES
jgi:hypothetical protein